MIVINTQGVADRRGQDVLMRRKRAGKITTGLLICVIISGLVLSCVPGGQSPDDMFTGNVFPGESGKWVGSSQYPYQGIVANDHYSWNGTAWVRLDDKISDGCRIWRSIDQAIPTGGWTPVSFDKELMDTSGMWVISVPDTVVIQRDGVYIIKGSVVFAYLGSAVVEHISITKNAAQVFYANWNFNAGYNTLMAISIQRCVIGDYFNLNIYQASGTDKIVLSTVYSPILEVNYIGR